MSNDGPFIAKSVDFSISLRRGVRCVRGKEDYFYLSVFITRPRSSQYLRGWGMGGAGVKGVVAQLSVH